MGRKASGSRAADARNIAHGGALTCIASREEVGMRAVELVITAALLIVAAGTHAQHLGVPGASESGRPQAGSPGGKAEVGKSDSGTDGRISAPASQPGQAGGPSEDHTDTA